jgi:hypothetical protein
VQSIASLSSLDFSNNLIRYFSNISDRDLVDKCGVAQLVSDTRFMSESILQDFTRALITMTEMEASDKKQNESATRPVDEFKADSCLVSLEKMVGAISEKIAPPSDESRAWLEMILVETSLRNRDRFSLLWSPISTHYYKTLGRVSGIAGAEIVVKFDYTTERSVRPL